MWRIGHGKNAKVLPEFVDVENAKQAGRASFGELVAFATKQPGHLLLLVEKTDRPCWLTNLSSCSTRNSGPILCSSKRSERAPRPRPVY
jgi:hypothetical protein